MGNKFLKRLCLTAAAGMMTVMLAMGAAAADHSAEPTTGGSWSGKYYLDADGKQVTDWRLIEDKTYYFKANGKRVSGRKKVEGVYYYFDKSGAQVTGWVKIGKNKYYFDPNQEGAQAQGFLKIKKKTYYFDEKGVMKTGLLKIGKGYYYFDTKGRMQTGWKTIKGKKYYFDPETGKRAKGAKVIDDVTYHFTKKGTLQAKTYTSDGNWVDADGKQLKKSTIKQFLQIALQPVGSTMYVWGGGWGVGDTAGGHISARTIGVSPNWKAFADKQSSSYDYRSTRYQYANGLDCSGYVGWVIYNAFNTKSGNAGYVMLAQKMASTYASYGWGKYTAAKSVKNFKAGDIMSLASGHVYIVIGQCSDGSVVLVHSSPKGVMISGTTTRSGSRKSKAIKLATKYMKKYYPTWYAKYPNIMRGTSYLTSYSQMRWTLKGSKRMMSDPDKYTKKSASAILEDLFSTKN